MQKELLEIERNIERLKLQYGGQALLDQAKKLQQSELMQLTKLKQQYTKLEKNIQRDSTRRYISATTKVSLIKAKKLADKLLGKDDPHVGAAHIRTDTRKIKLVKVRNFKFNRKEELIMEKQQEMVKVLCVDENDNHYIEEVPVEEINKAMEYANKLDELSAEERQDILSLIDKLHPEDLECNHN